MDEVPIGRAAQMLGLAPSALRYYEHRGLVAPHGRRGGRRVYGPGELRGLASVKIARELGLPLQTAAALLDGPNALWRREVSEQIDRLQRLIDRAQATQRFLGHALECPADHPVRDCPVLTSVLERVVNGMTVEDLLAEPGSAGAGAASEPGESPGSPHAGNNA